MLLTFTSLGKFLAIISLNTLLDSLHFSFLPGVLMIQMLDLLLSHRLWGSVPFFQLIFSHQIEWILLFFPQVEWFCPLSSPLFEPIKWVFITVTVFSSCMISVWFFFFNITFIYFLRICIFSFVSTESITDYRSTHDFYVWTPYWVIPISDPS